MTICQHFYGLFLTNMKPYLIYVQAFDRNHKMLQASDFVIALYKDDTWLQAKGGTAECMRYAKKNKKPIEQIVYSVTNNEIVMNGVKTWQ